MTTPYRRAFVSIAAITLTLVLGACVRVSSPPVLHGLSSSDARPLAMRFDNYANDHVHVYLIGAKRQWLLGRVEPGAVATLRIPEESLSERSSFVRLAVVRGERVTLQAARNPRAMMTVAQPTSAILSQHWRFAQGQLMSLAR